MADRVVLHVLPHAGAGAQTYIDVLAKLDGCRFELFELSASRSPGSAAASIAGRQPDLVRLARRADIVHVHGEVAATISLPWLVARPSVLTLHGLHLLRRMSAGMPRVLSKVNLCAVIAAASRTICVSRAEFDDLEWLPARAHSRLAVVLNGLPLPPTPAPETRANARAALALTPDQVAVLYLGQLEPRKDPLTAVYAVHQARLTNAQIVLLLAGDGPTASAVAACADDGIRMLGERTDVAELFAAADMFVMPSLREGLSYAILEALGHGLATVVSDAAGNTEAVGDAGVVFPAGDAGKLSDLLLELAGEPERRAALGAAGRARIANELTADRMLRGTAEVYESVLRPKR